jgi:CBS domain-containing protein
MKPPLTTVADCMTSGPHAIEAKASLSKAVRTMRIKGVRHLPVLDDGELVGVLTERDINLTRAVAQADPADLTVEEAMTPNPYVVSPDTPLSQVASAMAKRKIGSAVVMDGERLAGVFTTTDALHALAMALESGASLRRPSPVARLARSPRRSSAGARGAGLATSPDARRPRARDARLAAPLRGRPPRRTRHSAAR